MWSRHFSAILLKMIILSRSAIAKGMSFRTPVMSSWKYAGAWLSLKGTLMYSYFPMARWRLFFGIDDSSNGMWWYPLIYPGLRSTSCHWVGKNVSYLWHRPGKFSCDLVECTTRCFPPSPFGTTMMGADQLDQLPHITFAVRSLLNLILTPFVVFHCYWIRFLWKWLRSSCIYHHLSQWCCLNGGFILGKLKLVIL